MEFTKKFLKTSFQVPKTLIICFKQYKKLAETKHVKFCYSKWILCVIFVPLILLFYILLVIVKQFVNLAMLLKYKSKFGGMLKNQDAILAIEYPRPIMVNALLLIESKKSPQEFYEKVREHINKSLKTQLAFNPKICGTLNSFFGYAFIMRDELTIDECITKLKRTDEGETITKDELLKINEEGSSEALPKDNKGFWQVLIGTQPVDWDENSNKGDLKVYPVQFRFSHCLGDGIHVFKGVVALIGDRRNDISKETKTAQESFSSKLWIIFPNLPEIISKILTLIAVLLVNSLIATSTPRNILHGKKLSGRKFMCVNREESSNHLEVVRNIKKRYSDVSLSAVFATAFSASLTEYCQQHTSQIPKYITCSVAQAPRAVNLLRATPESRIVCKNDVGVYVPNLPTFVETKHDNINLLKMLKNNAQQFKQIHESGESEACRWMANKLAPNFPIFLFRFLGDVYDVHAEITNIPGPPSVTVMDGDLWQTTIPWCNHHNLTGIGLAVITYGGKLQMTLNIDTALVPEREEVQKILDDTYRYLKLLDEATTKDKK